MPTRNNMTAQLPVVLDVLSDHLENCFLFVEEDENFFFWLLQHQHFFRETGNDQAEARWNPESWKQKKTQIPTTK